MAEPTNDPRQRRLPAQPLFDLALAHTETGGRDATLGELAVVFDVSHRSIDRWRAEGLSIWQAERLAIHLGEMPWDVWPEFLPILDAEVAELERSGLIDVNHNIRRARTALAA